ncbi:head-tail connector protein [Celeribacter indicus]|uniref:Phage protein n=1 Tax=Celeribacter indicus TaxID=1208324 RepID=A0A0B5DW19_9RHOB|nr:head-tail connector protein [Celeribacter indicus]AJE47184.1 phage protein [Celeribacter indicus]SDW00242.1 phage conserved hypothetical protein, phiE125 gp8 family [Celeribacter indicus]
MAIVTLRQVKAQLSFSDDLGIGEDDDLIIRKIEAAQHHLERLLGFRIDETYGGSDQREVPPDLIEAVCQLSAWWYETREAAGEGAREMPFGVSRIVNEYREFTF